MTDKIEDKVSAKDKRKYKQMLVAFTQLVTLALSDNTYAAKILDKLSR